MRVWTLAIVVGVSATACADVDTELDDGLRVLIEDNELDGRPLGDMDVPEIDSPKAQLGMRLFFSKTLGGARDTACVSCHHPMLGGSKTSSPLLMEGAICAAAYSLSGNI